MRLESGSERWVWEEEWNGRVKERAFEEMGVVAGFGGKRVRVKEL